MSGIHHAMLKGVIPPDPFFANVSVLLKFPGANLSTTVVDSSTYNDTKICGAGQFISTTVPIWGTSSLYCSQRGPVPLIYTGSRFARPNNTAYTWEGWTRRLSTVAATQVPTILRWQDGSGNRLIELAQYSTGNNYQLQVGVAAAVQYPYLPNVDGVVFWSFVVKTDNTWEFAINGVLAASGAAFGTGTGANCSAWIGGTSSTDATAIGYLLDNIRGTQGVARYTTPYSVPGDFPAF